MDDASADTLPGASFTSKKYFYPNFLAKIIFGRVLAIFMKNAAKMG